MLRSLIFAVSLAAGASGAMALAGDGPGLETCPERLVAGQPALNCDCPSEATATGNVWGSDVYTDDSAICRAALHAGAIGTEGGAVFVVEAPGRDDYPAVTRNSVASSHWGSYGRSIAFRPVSEAGVEATLRACPGNAAGLTAGTRVSCRCSAEAASGGSVWGSGPYTGDSSLCRAAVHAGAIREGGGAIEVRVTPGRQSYQASARNGVNASPWGSFSTSFEVDR